MNNSHGHHNIFQFANDPTTWEPVPEERAHQMEQFAARLFDDEVALYRKRKSFFSFLLFRLLQKDMAHIYVTKNCM